MTALEPDSELLHAAFRDVHAARLYGFALLILHGDRPAAAYLTNATLHDHASRVPGLRHPERAAATLRADLLNRARRLRRPPVNGEERTAALRGLHVDDPTASAIGSLRIEARAAIVAADVERFGEEDVAMILGRSAHAARRAVAAARRSYLAAATTDAARHGAADGATSLLDPGTPFVGGGAVSSRIARVATRALAPVRDEVVA
jgi:hypothetical protein